MSFWKRRGRFDPQKSMTAGLGSQKDKIQRTSGLLAQRYTQNVVALWEVFYIEHKRFDLDTLRVPNWSPTPISKSNDSLGQSDDIWGARGPHFRPMLGGFPGPGPA